MVDAEADRAEALPVSMDKIWSERKNVIPIVRPEDLAIAVAAARTAWILSSIDHQHGDGIELKRSAPIVLERAPVPRLVWETGQCASMPDPLAQ